MQWLASSSVSVKQEKEINVDYKITAAGRDMLLVESTRPVQGEMF